MSTIWKAILVLVIIGAVGFGWKYMKSPNNSYTNNEQTGAPNAPGMSINNTTDASLDANMSSIDASMKTADQNSAQVDQSMSDKPVTQTE